MLQLPRVEWRLLACENGASPDCFIVVVVISDTVDHEKSYVNSSEHELCSP